jgi:soluble lytic murein transglycosylase-like protein
VHAGPGAVTRWREGRGELPGEIFVEEIPYGDTKAFVKAVLAAVQLQHHLAARDARVELARAP